MQTDRRRRLLEPIIVVGLFVTSAMILPLFFPCTHTDCVIEQVSGEELVSEPYSEPLNRS